MKKIIIGDNYRDEFGDCVSLKELADKVKSNVNKGDVILVYINFKFNESSRLEQSGMELLIWLRLLEIMNHCILCSFESFHSLLNRQPKCLIASSDGTTLLNLPVDISSIEIAKLNHKIADIENLKTFLKPAFSIDVFRHDEANWWGILVQWKMHQYIRSDFKLPYPKIINDRNLELNSSVAKYLYLRKYALKQKDFGLIEKTRLFVQNRKPKILQIDDQADDGWAEVNQHIIYGKLNPDLYKYVKITDTDTVESIFKAIIQIIFPQTSNERPFTPDVVLLDVRLLPKKDEAEKRVENLSGSLILKKLRKEFIGLPVIITTASNKVWTYQELIKLGADAYWIKEGIDEVKSTEDSLNNYEQFIRVISHTVSDEYKLLRAMAEKVKSLNSNKFWWENKNWGVGRIEIKGKYEALNTITKVRKEEVENIYLDAIELYREFLTTKLLYQGFKISSKNDWFYYSSVILHLGKIIELTHNLSTKEYDKYGSFSYVMLKRGDTQGKNIYAKRNSAAHLGKSKYIDFQFMSNFIRDLNKYLHL